METACWLPAITTDRRGMATVTLALPEQSTRWRLMIKGITAETLAGEATDTLVVEKDLFGELKLPASFTDGDQADVIASIHHDTAAKGPVQVTLETTVAGRRSAETKTIETTGSGVQEVSFHVSLSVAKQVGTLSHDSRSRTGEAAEFVLTVTAANGRDQVYRSVPVLPYGAPVYATAGGSADSDATVWVRPPQSMTLQRPALSILIGPTVERSLLDAVLSPPPPCQAATGRIASDVETATSDLMAAIGLQELFGGRDAAPQAEVSRCPHSRRHWPAGGSPRRRRRMELGRRGRP